MTEQLAYFPGNFYIILLLSLTDYLLGLLSSCRVFPWRFCTSNKKKKQNENFFFYGLRERQRGAG